MQLIAVEPTTGRLVHRHEPQVDLFGTVEEALDAVTVARGHTVRSQTAAAALLGYFALEGAGFLLVATRVTADAAYPGGHTVLTVAESAWLRVPLASAAGGPLRREQRGVDVLAQYTLNGYHYYCETADITRPFASQTAGTTAPAEDGGDRAFCWNEWLASSFAREGLRAWCPVLLQGAARSRHVRDAGVTVCMLTRKLAGNPGTRYNARGLNSSGVPGNEMECEIIVWTPPEVVSQTSASATDATTTTSTTSATTGETKTTQRRWASFVFRRGTVPVWWRSEPRAVGESAIAVRAESPFEGTGAYLAGLAARHAQPLYLVNLLRIDPEKDELVLTAAYQAAVAAAKKQRGLDVTLLNYDWHGNRKMFGDDRNVEALWHLLATPLRRTGLSTGVITVKDGNSSSSSEGDTMATSGTTTAGTTTTTTTIITIQNKQTGVLRLNCADSLDRTNVACFYVSWHAVAEMCRRLGCPDFAASSTTDTETEEWPLLEEGMELVRARLQKARVLEALADLFVAVGDVCSMLYTNSPAAHSEALRALQPVPAPAPSNAVIALQRRYQNLLHDALRQATYELFCGTPTTQAAYFPALAAAHTLGPLELATDWPAACLTPLASTAAPEGGACADVLLAERGAQWLVPEEDGAATLLLALRGPCVARELVLTLASPVPALCSPHTVSVRAGPYRDRLRPVYHRLRLPAAARGTALALPLPPSLWDAYDDSYNPAGNRGAGADPVRFVEVAFARAPGDPHCLLLGHIAVLGRPLLQPNQRGDKDDNTAVVDGGDGDNDTQVKDEQVEDEQVEGHSGDAEDHSDAHSESADSPAPATPSPDVEEPHVDHKDALEQYTKAVAALAQMAQDSEIQQQQKQPSQQQQKQQQITFLDVLELEVLRLRLGITTSERDAVLVAHDMDRALCPLEYMYQRDEKTEEAVANSVDAATAAHDQHQEQQCAECGEKGRALLTCRYCRRRVCGACKAAAPCAIPEYAWRATYYICRACAALCRRHDACLREIALRHRAAVGFARTRRRPLCQPALLAARARAVTLRAARPLCALRGRETPLAQYPFAAFVDSVPCARGSPPAEVLLLSPDDDEEDGNNKVITSLGEWHAPKGLRECTLRLLLPGTCLVTTVAVAGAYTAKDAPTVAVDALDDTGATVASASWTLAPDTHALQSHTFARAPCARQLVFRFALPTEGEAHADEQQQQLHAGRISVRGTPLVSAEPPAGTSAASVANYINYLCAQPPGPPVATPLPVLAVARRVGRLRGTVDLTLSTTRTAIHGFTLRIEHANPFLAASSSSSSSSSSQQQQQQTTALAAPPLTASAAAAAANVTAAAAPPNIPADEGAACQVRLVRVQCITVTQWSPTRASTACTVLGKFLVPKCREGTTLTYRFDGAPPLCTVFRYEYLSNYGSREYTAPGKISVF